MYTKRIYGCYITIHYYYDILQSSSGARIKREFFSDYYILYSCYYLLKCTYFDSRMSNACNYNVLCNRFNLDHKLPLQ